MLKRLRRTLTLTFIFISLLIYAIVVPVGIVIFAVGLNNSVDSDLRRLVSDTQPSIQFSHGVPSLKAWADSAASRHVHILGAVQLFDSHGALLESYGQPGVPQLLDGPLRADPRGHHKSIRSHYVRLNPGGFLQMQVETKQVDDAIGQFVLTMFLLAPILLAATGACGWFFSAKAVIPVARSMHVLRRFVGDAAHELKTPTTIIEAGTQTLEDMSADMPKAREIVDVLSRASQRLRKLAEDLVLLARMDSPELALDKQVLSLDELVSQVAEDFTELAKSKELNLKVSVVPSAKIWGNADSLSRAVMNLIDNALRYTESGGTVSVTLTGSEAQWHVSVEDTGIGIPKRALPFIFDRFYRVDESRARAIGGTGLGLSIVQSIVEAHGGTITVTSEEGKGTKFVVSIPARVLHSPSPATAQKRPDSLTTTKGAS